MSVKKTKNPNGFAKGLLFVLILFLLVVFSFLLMKLFSSNYYKKESRIDKVKNTVIKSDTNTYETVGWVKVQGTTIDLPILYNSNYDYPVELDGYAWASESTKSMHNHMTILGHNIFNLSSKPILSSKDYKRFEELMNFVYYDFAKDNQYFQVTMDGEDYLYKVFMVGFVPILEEVFFPTSEEYSKEEMNQYLEKLSEYNLYKYDLDVNSSDKVVALSTCTRFYGITDKWSFYVVGRMVRDNEKINHYSVQKSEKYSEIEKILKGDEYENKDEV